MKFKDKIIVDKVISKIEHVTNTKLKKEEKSMIPYMILALGTKYTKLVKTKAFRNRSIPKSWHQTFGNTVTSIGFYLLHFHPTQLYHLTSYLDPKWIYFEIGSKLGLFTVIKLRK